MVIYRGADGKPGYYQTDDLDDAIRCVERLRNDDGVESARLYNMHEVTFEFRPYYRVELAGSSSALPSPESMMATPAFDPVPDAAAESADEAPAEAAAETPAPTGVETETSPWAAEPQPDAEPVPAGNGNPSRRGLFGR